jgi:integration host factor subunit alpha
MTLTKKEIIEDVSRNGLTKKRSGRLVESLLEIIKSTLESGEDLLISGFGKFCVKNREKRRGRNPITGEDLLLDAKRVILFRCSPGLRDRLNANGEGP